MPLFHRRAVRQLTSACLLAAAFGVHAELPRHNSVNFSATAHREVVQDELTVVLEAVKDGSQAADVQADLKRVLEAALTEARALIRGAAPEAVSVQTGKSEPQTTRSQPKLSITCSMNGRMSASVQSGFA